MGAWPGKCLTGSVIPLYNCLETLYYEVIMGDVVDFEEFKAKKLKRLEDEWLACMARADAFTAEGKQKFANEMFAKAKALRKEIDKLRKPKEKEPVEVSPVSWVYPTTLASMTYSYDGLSSADMGHRKEPQMYPEPENN